MSSSSHKPRVVLCVGAQRVRAFTEPSLTQECTALHYEAPVRQLVQSLYGLSRLDLESERRLVHDTITAHELVCFVREAVEKHLPAFHASKLLDAALVRAIAQEHRERRRDIVVDCGTLLTEQIEALRVFLCATLPHATIELDKQA